MRRRINDSEEFQAAVFAAEIFGQDPVMMLKGTQEDFIIRVEAAKLVNRRRIEEIERMKKK